MTGNEIKMPVKVTPFDHQKKAFLFVLEMFGILEREGDANADSHSDLQLLRSRVHQKGECDS